MRVRIPEGEHPTLWTTRKLGSPRLIRSRDEANDAAYFNDSPLTPREREMIRMIFVYETDCNLCSETRATKDMPGYGDGEEIPEELYEHLHEFRTWPAYTDRERLLMEFCERYMRDYQDLSRDQAFWERLTTTFSEVELADLCLLAGHWEIQRRLLHLLIGVDQVCEIPGRAGHTLLSGAAGA
jgi:alkylhydroperoxidase family enzyme